MEELSHEKKTLQLPFGKKKVPGWGRLYLSLNIAFVFIANSYPDND